MAIYAQQLCLSCKVLIPVSASLGNVDKHIRTEYIWITFEKYPCNIYICIVGEVLVVPDRRLHNFVRKTTFLPAVFQQLMSWIKQDFFFFPSGRLGSLFIFLRVEDKKEHEISYSPYIIYRKVNECYLKLYINMVTY